MERMTNTGFAITKPDGTLLVTTLRRRRQKAILAYLKEGETWAWYQRCGYRVVQVAKNGLIAAD